MLLIKYKVYATGNSDVQAIYSKGSFILSAKNKCLKLAIHFQNTDTLTFLLLRCQTTVSEQKNSFSD